MNNLKIRAAILCFCGIALIISACSSNNKGVTSYTDSMAADKALTENTNSIEPRITVFESEVSKNDTEGASVEEAEEVLKVTYSPSDIEDTDDIRVARDCLIAYESSICGQKEYADLGKYIDNKYLKEYLDESVKKHYENGYVSQWELNISTQECKEASGINYITFNCHYEGYGNNRGSILCHNQIGVRDGRVVSFNDWYFLSLYSNLWDSNITDDMAFHGYDVSYYPNPWDDEKVAKRAVDALKKFYSNEYDSYAEAWESLGE